GLDNRIRQQYLSGYLSRYDFQTYAYGADSRPLNDSVKASLSGYKNLVLAGSIKVSEFFYRINNTFGYQNYFALLPVRDGDNLLGTLVLELKSQQIITPPLYSSILAAGDINEDFNLSGYSYAFYRDGRLLTQFGQYTYSLVNSDYNAPLQGFNRLVNRDLNYEMYDHMVYRPNRFKLIVVSKPVYNYTTQLAAISFVFIVLIAFTALVTLVRELWLNFRKFNFDVSKYRIKYFLYMNHMLYKTRIQLSMVGTVVFTLIVTGIITFYNISQQYRAQQSQSLLEKINRITEGFNKELFKNSTLPLNAQTELAISSFAKINAADLNLYNTAGELVFTTQPKLYKGGFLAPRINPQAYVYLHKLHKLEYVNNEHFGTLKYITAYSAIRNNRNEPMGYLSLPYLTNEQEYEEKVGVFLNALINVYTLVFVAIGFFAVFVANKITNPLTLIQKILSETKIGRKNEPIIWNRHDEIGNLIREYNTMISALDDSADKLARSERENAWREMAKQIAHEIKNPLTPLKLGVQLLEKSWKENDPNFNKKFEKFSKSFIEQIESLSLIASEFSNFAKMPDTVLRTVNLREIIERSVEVYSQDEKVAISFDDHTGMEELLVKGDKDQLLRSFNNLIKNSIEAIPEERAGQIRITVQLLYGYVRVTIADNGNGIPESVQERIFMPNFTTKSSGTGLGLAFVKQAIENMGGSINYETEIEKGTIFYLNIPIIT
ncbi:MAG TPA: ATP-binding protein, partial [Sphingobacteriaceae bacterium]